jgi:hypothetical protein
MDSFWWDTKNLEVGGEMTQALYAHMNNKIKKKFRSLLITDCTSAINKPTPKVVM